MLTRKRGSGNSSAAAHVTVCGGQVHAPRLADTLRPTWPTRPDHPRSCGGYAAFPDAVLWAMDHGRHGRWCRSPAGRVAATTSSLSGRYASRTARQLGQIQPPPQSGIAVTPCAGDRHVCRVWVPRDRWCVGRAGLVSAGGSPVEVAVGPCPWSVSRGGQLAIVRWCGGRARPCPAVRAGAAGHGAGGRGLHAAA